MVESALYLSIALACYLGARWIYRRSNHHVLALPVVGGVALLWLTLTLPGLDADDFLTHTQPLRYLMDLAVVAMALPLYTHARHLLRQLWPLLTGLLVASATSIVGNGVLAWCMGLPWSVALSVAPKAATMPVALALVNPGSGWPALTVLSVFLTGMTGALLVPMVLRWSGLHHEPLQAFTLGASAHAIGLARAQAEHPGWQAYAVFGMCGNALLTPVLMLPWMH